MPWDAELFELSDEFFVRESGDGSVHADQAEAAPHPGNR